MNAPENLPTLDPLVELIPLAHLHPSPTNPRRSFPEAKLAEMAESIRRHGVLQPILTRPWPETDGYRKLSATARYEIIAGERRYRASTLAGMPAIPAMVRHLTDIEVLEIQIIENLQREDVHPLEEAEGYQVLMLRTGYTADQLAEKVGKSKAYIYARLKLCAIGGKAREAFMAGELSASVALLVARIPIPALQERAAKEIMEGRHGRGAMSAREAADHVQENYMLRLSEAPFPRGDAKLVEGVPTCAKCPKRTGNARELYPDVKSADVCTDPDCFGAKKVAQAVRQIDAARAQGMKVLEGKAAEKILPYGGCSIQSHTDLKDGWVQPDKTVHEAGWDGKGYPTWRSLLGEDWKPAAVTVDARTGQTIELMQEKAARAAAEAKGVKLRQNGRTERSEADKTLERRKKEETAYRTLLLGKIIEAAQGRDLTMPTLVEIARGHWERLWFEHQKRLAKALVGKPNHEGINEVTAEIGKALDPRMVMTACCLVGQVDVGYKPDEKPERMLAFAQRLGVDAEAIKTACTPAANGKSPAKAAGIRYRHPDDPYLTWSGKGQKPNWVKGWLSQGHTLDRLEVAA